MPKMTLKETRKMEFNRMTERSARLITMAKTLRNEIKIMKFQIHNMSLLAKQAEDYASNWDLLSGESEPTFKWTIYNNY